MSFEIKGVEGTVDQIEVDLAAPSQHAREEFVIDEVKKAINHIVTSLGGYLSVSCNGNINQVEGETGDLVQIYITSLPTPPSAQTAPVIENPNLLNPENKTNEEIEKEAQENIAVAQQTIPPIGGEGSDEPVVVPTTPVSTPAEALPVETSPVIEETPTSTEPSTAPVNPAEAAPEGSPEVPVPPVEPAV